MSTPVDSPDGWAAVNAAYAEFDDADERRPLVAHPWLMVVGYLAAIVFVLIVLKAVVALDWVVN